MAGQLEVADRGRPISGIGRPHLLSENRNRKARDLNGLACSSLTTSIWSDQLSARSQIWTGVFFRANDAEEGGASVPRSIGNVRLESSVVNKGDPLGQTWRKPSPMGNHRLPIGRHQPRAQKAGHHSKGVTRPIPERNLTFAYELETWWLAGCRHDQQQALSRWRDSKRISVPIDCLQCSLGHGRRSRAFYWAR